MGSPISGEEGFPSPEGGEELGGFGGEEPANDKPFDDTPFDAGVEADEESDPTKYIQQLAGKLGQSLRKHTGETGQPDFDLEKFAINSVLSATNSSEMDQNDQNDIINKVKNANTDGDGGNGGADAPEGGEEAPEDGGEELDFSDIDMDEGFNPNHGGKTVFQNATLDVDDGGMEENKYLNLESVEKNSIFVTKAIEDMLMETLRSSEAPTITPTKTPVETPTKKPSRKSKPWRIIPEAEPEPKAEDSTPITFINGGKFNDDSVEITFDVDDVRFVETFTNSNEVLTKPNDYDEPWVYNFVTEPLSNRKQYGVAVSFYGHPKTDLRLDGFTDGNAPEITEIG